MHGENLKLIASIVNVTGRIGLKFGGRGCAGGGWGE